MNAYRKGVGIFLLNKSNKLWVGKRIDYKNNYWQMPQGGIDDYESEKQAMKRELGEEVGIKKKIMRFYQKVKNGFLMTYLII